MIYDAYRSSRVLQVGHLLGLGDRHLDNILLHRGAAQLVHIDFSVVFDRCAAEHVIRPNSNIGCCGTKSSRANLARSRCVLAPLQPEAISSKLCAAKSCCRGLQLKVPEVVPFRLTQTLVAALGVTGAAAGGSLLDQL
jgi:hypothetical protein